MRFQTAVISGLLRRALARRLGRVSLPSGLFYPVCLALAGGVLAAIDAGSETPGFALDSVWLYRAEVGLAFMGALYIVGLILWLAWHGRGFVEFGAFGVTLKASESERVEATEAGLTGTKKQISTLEKIVIDGFKEVDVRVSALEKRGRPSDES